MTPLPLRRNGKEQACGPCRRRKVACDHGYPVCNRCRKRKEEPSCIYITQPPETTTPSTSKRPRRARSVSEHVPQSDISPPGGHLAGGDVPMRLPSEVDDVNRSIVCNNNSIHSDDILNDLSSSGYLGPTSISAVLQETQQNLLPGLLSSTDKSRKISTPAGNNASQTWISDFEKQQAVHVLRQLPPDFNTALGIFERIANPNDCWSRVAGKRLIVLTWNTFGSYLSDTANLSELDELASTIFENTNRPLPETETFEDAGKWLSTFSGKNTRWESLAVIFIYLALGVMASSIPGHESKHLLVTYKECCSTCISLATSRGNANTMLIYAIYKRSTIEAFIHGDESFTYWSNHAEAVAMLTFLGLHVGANNSHTPYKPSILPEIQRRLFYQIYIMDKSIATFVGRPPLLTLKYCTTSLPTDLDDRILLPDDQHIEQENASVSDNKDGINNDVYASTILRARARIAFIREEILEGALSPSRSIPVEQVEHLKVQELENYSQLPSPVLYSCSQDMRSFSPALMYAKILIRMEHLMNLFLLERLKAMQNGIQTPDLLSVSYEMGKVALLLWKYKDRLAGFHGEFEWLVIGHAAPAAGVLCNFLSTTRTTLANPSAETPTDTPFTRSSIIQQLSVLVNFLEWVGPTQPNSALATKVKETIEHVLDLVLNATAYDPNADSGFDFGVNELPGFELLDTFDWFRGDGGGLA